MTAPTPSGDVSSLIEGLAQWLHDETDHPDSFVGYAWPEHPDDTGQRDDAWVKLVPKDVQARFREMASGIITFLAGRASHDTEAAIVLKRYREALEFYRDKWSHPDFRENKQPNYDLFCDQGDKARAALKAGD